MAWTPPFLTPQPSIFHPPPLPSFFPSARVSITSQKAVFTPPNLQNTQNCLCNRRYQGATSNVLGQDVGKYASLLWTISKTLTPAPIYSFIHSICIAPLRVLRRVLGQHGKGQNGTVKMAPIESSINQAIQLPLTI